MGNACSSNTSESTDLQTLINDYLPVRKEKDPRYGEITLLEHKTTREFAALKDLHCNSTSDYKQDMKELAEKSRSEPPKYHQTTVLQV